MKNDASLPPHAPMTNGTSHGEADASTAINTDCRPLSEVCADLHGRVSRFLAATPEDETTKQTQLRTRIALGVIEKALNEYSFPALSLSYNGGKDCLVLLILYLAQLHTYFTSSSSSPPLSPAAPASSTFPPSIPSIYAKPPDPFPAITTFVATSSTAYHLSLTHITTTPSHQIPRVTFRDAFEIYLKSNPGIKAIFVGTRRTDPHGKYLTHFDRTDKGWPDFMRIHPVIDWHLSEIWCFLRAKELGEADGSHLAYCSMYDEGYTSLGGVNDTLKNPKLKEGGGNYRPAYELTKDSEERLGR